MKPREDEVGVSFNAAEAAYIQPHILKSTIWWPAEQMATTDTETEFCVDADDAQLLLSVFSERSITLSHERQLKRRYIPRHLAQAALTAALEQGALLQSSIQESLQLSQELRAQQSKQQLVEV